MSIVEALRKEVDRLQHEEKIGDACPADYVSDVDLEIAFSPVVNHSVGNPCHIPKPDRVEKQADGRYLITWPEAHNFEFVDEESLKLMRARFLLLRGFYHERFKSFAPREREKILAWYFPEGMFRFD